MFARRLAVTLSVLLCLSLVVVTRSPADPPAKSTKAGALALLAEGDRLADRQDFDKALLKYKDAYEEIVADLRGLKFRDRVAPKFMTRRQLRDYMIKSMTEDYSEAELIEMDRSLKAFRLVPDDMDVKQTLTNLLTEEVGGFYNPKNKNMVLIKEEVDPKRKKGLFDLVFGSDGFDKDEAKVTLAHEMVHALQDQHFDLQAMDKVVKRDDDMALALSALVEGEATLVMFAEMLRDDGDPRAALKMPPQKMDLAFAALKGFMPFASGRTFQRSPLILRESLIFPYHKGTVFVLHLTNRSQWKLVDRAFREPPTSTEQILHPEKYFDKNKLDEPQQVDLPDVAAAVGPGWKRVGYNVMGEFATMILLADYKGASGKTAQAAAAGWDGDRYAVFESADKRLGLVWMTTWDSEKDAEEFAAAYADRLAKKLSETARAPLSAPPPGAKPLKTKPAIMHLSRWERTYHIERRGQEVAVIEGFSAEATAKLAELAFTAKKSPKKFVRVKK
jgi:hypothetical protein